MEVDGSAADGRSLALYFSSLGRTPQFNISRLRPAGDIYRSLPVPHSQRSTNVIRHDSTAPRRGRRVDEYLYMRPWLNAFSRCRPTTARKRATSSRATNASSSSSNSGVATRGL